jgi:crotonobetainyl-CoA:carnitine CoA-transferase CaiB-like acyl-CoA transferase
MGDKEWAALARAFDRPELLDDPRFKTSELRDRNVNERLSLIQDELKSRPTREWLEILDREEVPCAPALTRNEVLEHPQVIASEVLKEHDHPVAGRVRQARVAARFEGTPPVQEPQGAPRLGEHNRQILAELGYSKNEIEALRDAGAIGQEDYPE